MSKFGRQPGYIEVRKRGITVLANEIPTSASHLSRTLRGYVRPRPEVCQRLPELLGMPLEGIFTERVLAKPYDPERNPWLPLDGA